MIRSEREKTLFNERSLLANEICVHSHMSLQKELLDATGMIDEILA